MIKAIFLDWLNTLYNYKAQELFPDAIDLLKYLKPKYKLAVMSQSDDPIPIRVKAIESLTPNFFDEIFITKGSKDALYEEALKKFNLNPEEVAVIDDRVIKGIQWGNKRKVTTIWMKRNDYEPPTEVTGQPTHTVTELEQLKEIL
jgi:FMN phosphatase YigB (HAD superfamily)|tara:strand:- start:106 stop:540 length:435 start_codon:yes stop_codon:yes gene_type:complete